MSSELSSKLFACSKCFSRHPYEELSVGQQLCKECRGHYPVVKCTYCRSEFQQTTKNSTTTICKKCEQNVKQYGRPSPCEYCNIIAAFIGTKCQRCTNCEQKYGPPGICQQCRQKCAFDRQDDDKIDGRLLCWLCTLSFKRTLAKSKESEMALKAHMKFVALIQAKQSMEAKLRSSSSRRPKRPDVTKLPPPTESSNYETISASPTMAKIARISNVDVLDPNSSDHVVAMTQLREQNAFLLKTIVSKDTLLFAKDKMITELKAKQFEVEKDFRKKIKDQEQNSDKKMENLMQKIKSLQKEVATLSKGVKKNLNNSAVVKESSGSETASPSIC